MSMTGSIRAPWDDETVAALNAYQVAEIMHPYTCGGEHEGESVPLLATRDGWVCPLCDYAQDWAHAFSIELGAQKGVLG